MPKRIKLVTQMPTRLIGYPAIPGDIKYVIVKARSKVGSFVAAVDLYAAEPPSVGAPRTEQNVMATRSLSSLEPAFLSGPPPAMPPQERAN